MPERPKKSRWGRRLLFSILTFFFLAALGLYFVLSSPRFLHIAIDKINHIIPGQIAYEDLNFNFPKGELSATQLQYINEEGEAGLEIGGLDMRFRWTSVFRGRLDIRMLQVAGLKIDVRNFPKSEGPSQWRKVLQLIFGRLSIERSFISPFDIAMKKGNNLHLEGLAVELTPQILENQEIHLDLSKSVVSLGDKKFTTGKLNFSGNLDVPVLEEYNFFVEEAKGRLVIEEIKALGLDASSLQTHFAIDGNTLILKKGEFENPHGKLQIDLEFDSDKPAIELELKNETPIDFSMLPSEKERLETTFTAFSLDLKADVAGKSLKELSGSIDLELDAKGNPQHDSTPDHHLSLKGKMKNGALEFTLFQITSDKMDLKGTGTVDFANEGLDVKITTDNFDITTLINTLADIDLTGYADAEGTITGTFRNPNFHVQAKAEEAGYSFLNFGKISGLFKIEDGTLSFEGGSPEGTEYFTKVKVVVEELFVSTRRTTLTSQFRNLETGKLLQSEEFHGKVTGSFDLEASQGNEDGKLQAKIEDFGLYGFEFEFLEVTGELKNDQFILDPLKFQPQDYETFTVPEPVVFAFDDKGWNVKGILFTGITLEGKFLKSQPTKVDLDIEVKNADLRPILATLSLPVKESYADGKVAMKIGVEDNPTSIDLMFTSLNLPLEEGFLKNDGDIEVLIRPPKVEFRQAKFLSGEGSFAISGSYTLDGPLALKLDGTLDMGVLEFVPKYFREAQGYAKMDLKVGGTLDNPNLQGDLTFENAGVTLRPVRGRIENLNGTLKFTPGAVVFDNFRGTMREGDLNVRGKITLKDFNPAFYDLEIDTREVAISEPGTYKVIFSGDFTLKGPAGKVVLSGIMDINDGVYSRDFNITKTLLKPETPGLKKEPLEFVKNLWLDMQIRSPGELAVKNNIARIYFNSDIKLTGPATNPKISGALTVLDGEFSYYTVDFEGATGTIDFRDPKKGPHVNILLEKDYQSGFAAIVAFVQIEGFTDNLRMTFTSSPPLERKDLMALVFTGVLPGDARRNLSGTNLATTVVASQLTQVISRPLAKKAHLDILRLEATDPEQTAALSRLVIGKTLTDRLSLEFKTDLGVDKPLQGVQMEYLLIDNVLIKATQFSDGEFEGNLALRFRLF